jgi:hypothetical protein
MPIADHRITDEASFTAATNAVRKSAGLYFYMTLDVLVDLAHKVSLDFFARPHLYTNLADGALAAKLATLRARYGSHEKIPSREDRLAMFTPLFGPASGDGDFARLRDDLNASASAFAERVYDTGEDMLRERVRTAHRPFKEYLLGLQGSSLDWSRDEVFTEVAGNLAYPILKDLGVVSVFGVATAPVGDWPYTGDSNAAKAVARIAEHRVDESGATFTFPLSRETFSQLQRSALRGAEALATIIDFDEAVGTAQQRRNDLNRLITKCYTWGSALPNQGPPRTAPPSASTFSAPS